MAWIAEAGLPVHMHVEKVRFLLQSEAKVWPSIFQGKSLQFDQWRIAHLAEFGINNFDSPSTPAPSRHGQGQERTKDSAKRPPRTPKSKRKEKSEREASERRAKTRRDSEPTHQPEEETEKVEEQNKENAKPNKFGSLFGSLSCGQCGAGFANLMEYLGHKKVCIPDEDFGFEEKTKPEPGEHKEQDSRTEEDNFSTEKRKDDNLPEDVNSTTSTASTTCSGSKREKESQPQINAKSEKNLFNKSMFDNLGLGPSNKTSSSSNNSGLVCDLCGSLFTSMVKYDAHRTKGCDSEHK